MNIIKRLFKTKSKVTIYFDKDGMVLEAIGDIGLTRRGRAAFVLRRGRVHHTFRYKLRYFIRAMIDALSNRIDSAYAYHTAIHQQACDVPVIGLLENPHE